MQVQVEKCAKFWEISHLHLRNFSLTVCIILSSAHIKSLIYFSLSVPGVQNEHILKIKALLGMLARLSLGRRNMIGSIDGRQGRVCLEYAKG